MGEVRIMMCGGYPVKRKNSPEYGVTGVRLWAEWSLVVLFCILFVLLGLILLLPAMPYLILTRRNIIRDYKVYCLGMDNGDFWEQWRRAEDSTGTNRVWYGSDPRV